MKINYIDLFSGIGGFPKGLQDANISFEKHYFSEIDKNCIGIYQNHFPNAIGVGNACSIRDVSIFGEIDLITFGFPCQDLSTAGKRQGLSGSRSCLFYEAIRFIKELKPKYFIFENVKGLLSNKHGEDFTRCLQEIANLGIYVCEWQLVNTGWILPQNRERVFFVGHLGENSCPKVFPFTEDDKKIVGIQRQQVKCLTTKGTHTAKTDVIERQQFPEKDYLKIDRKGNLKSNQDMASCLTAGAHSGGNHSDMDLLITHNHSKVRRLTPIEWERLQGFPDHWTALDNYGNVIKDTNRYKALGNTVSTPIVKMIAQRLFS